MKKKKNDLLVEGLLGKIAYSSKLLEDPKTKEKISKLIDNKLFMKQL